MFNNVNAKMKKILSAVSRASPYFWSATNVPYLAVLIGYLIYREAFIVAGKANLLVITLTMIIGRVLRSPNMQSMLMPPEFKVIVRCCIKHSSDTHVWCAD